MTYVIMETLIERGFAELQGCGGLFLHFCKKCSYPQEQGSAHGTL